MKLVNVQLSDDVIAKIIEDLEAVQASEGHYLNGEHITDEEKPELAISVYERERAMALLRKALGAEQPTITHTLPSTAQ